MLVSSYMGEAIDTTASAFARKEHRLTTLNYTYVPERLHKVLSNNNHLLVVIFAAMLYLK
ncbi:hypothetical protein [Brunnivagina elsteri]|uniref:hypothetical protein n=1 Tax=Brunnivagina elsteri TaxID=1247191 RepID=UPI001177E897|nr:hypothetical protein [Calothrix elsteri]